MVSEQQNERAPLIWYHLDTGTLHPTQRDNEDYKELHKEAKKFKYSVGDDIFPPPNFDNPYCKKCEYAIVCKERYPNAWARRTETKPVSGLYKPETPLTGENPDNWIKELYGPDFIPEKRIETPIGPRGYTIFGENLEEAKKAISLSAFNYWSKNIRIVKEEEDYIRLESETRMPKKLKERLQKNKLEVYEKLREMETIIQKGHNL